MEKRSRGSLFRRAGPSGGAAERRADVFDRSFLHRYHTLEPLSPAPALEGEST